MVISKDPVTPETLKQQTLDSHVKKSKHGRNLTKKLDNVERTAIKKEEPIQTNQNIKTEPVTNDSNETLLRCESLIQ